MAEHADQDDDWRNEEFRRDHQNLFQTCADITGTLGNADAESSDDDHAQRRETSKIGNHFGHKCYEGLRGKHVGYGNFFPCRRMQVAKMNGRTNCGNDTGNKECGNEEHGNIGDFITDSFNPAEEASDLIRGGCRGSVLICHWDNSFVKKIMWYMPFDTHHTIIPCNS